MYLTGGPYQSRPKHCCYVINHAENRAVFDTTYKIPVSRLCPRPPFLPSPLRHPLFHPGTSPSSPVARRSSIAFPPASTTDLIPADLHAKLFARVSHHNLFSMLHTPRHRTGEHSPLTPCSF